MTLNQAIETAKAKAAGNAKWTRAIERAAAGLQSGDICVSLFANGEALVTTVTNSHVVNGKCSCDAAKFGHRECVHRAAKRLTEMMDETTTTYRPPTSAIAPMAPQDVVVERPASASLAAEKYRIAFNGQVVDTQVFDTPQEAVKEMGRVRDALQSNNANQVAVEFAPGIPSERGLLPDLFTVYPMCGGKNVYRIELASLAADVATSSREHLICEITNIWPRFAPGVPLYTALLARFGKSHLDMLDDGALRDIRMAIAL